MEDESESSHVVGDPATIKDGPGKEEHGFHVEDNEEHRNNVEARGITAAGVGFWRNAAFVGEKLCITDAGFGANELENNERNDGKRKNKQREDQNRDVGGGHRFASLWMLAQNRGNNSRERVTEHLLFKEEFSGTLRGFHYGLDEGDAQLPFLEFQDAVDGAAGRSSDRVFQKRGVIAGFQDNAGGPFHSLRSQTEWRRREEVRL